MAVATDTRNDDTGEEPKKGRTKVRDVVAGIVACMGLATLIGVVAIAVLSLPDADKGPNIVAIATAALGVIGPIVGAYFGVRSAANAIEKVKESL
jgi:hypothetical protein